MTVLSIVQDAADEIGLPTVSQVVGNEDPTVKALYRALVKEGRDLLKEDPAWSFLIREYTFDTVDGQEEYALPDDYQRMLNNTCWDRNQFWQVRGGITPQQWQVIRSGLYQTARLSSNFRLKANADGTKKAFFLDPVPSSVRTLVFEMQSTSWFYEPPGTLRIGKPEGDGWEIKFDDDLVTRGVVWRFKAMRNLAFAADLADYQSYRDALIAQDRAPPTLTVNESPWRLPLGNIPDTGFGIT